MASRTLDIATDKSNVAIGRSGSEAGAGELIEIDTRFHAVSFSNYKMSITT